ncbi:pilus assembly protein CpaC [Desulfosarcina widdelii]|uniref:Pilus assembly protein CpaC n=1 Tax=Desulfosarcina widdelii TaxID=947919 RepID=A0A5K7Z212_9BACT|nr:type II and III secretion system protein family protein [Desulfosarcina widdelii]BBO74948.1 pilus assembly protein CpaC [Desulfosarcina widdelii]
MLLVKQSKNLRAAVLVTILILLMVDISWSAELLMASQTHTVKKLNLLVGKSIVLKSEASAKRISIANPDIADFVLISPNEVYITAKSVGTTNMTLWQKQGGYQVFDLHVGFDVSLLKQDLNQILPEEKDLRVTAAKDSITLSGRVSDAANLSRVLTIARSYAPGGKVNNLVEVRGVQQVMLEVRVAEMQRSLGKRMGVNFNYLSQSGNYGFSFLGGLSGLNEDGELIFSDSVNALFEFTSNGTNWMGFIDALKSDGLVKVLAEPTLIAMSGESAYFLAGGEFPIPVPSGDGDITIDYREFGVRLAFTPTVLSGNKINIRVAPEVSELDFTTAVQFEGFVTPGLSTRKTETVIELADGQSFAIAGLLRDTARDTIDKFPFLGDIPVLGALFRSRSYQKNETELVIIATPHLVKPLDMKNQTLPTDFYTEPNDAEFYVLGVMEGENTGSPTNLIGDLDGEFGHAMPEKK